MPTFDWKDFSLDRLKECIDWLEYFTHALDNSKLDDPRLAFYQGQVDYYLESVRSWSRLVREAWDLPDNTQGDQPCLTTSK